MRGLLAKNRVYGPFDDQVADDLISDIPEVALNRQLVHCGLGLSLEPLTELVSLHDDVDFRLVEAGESA